MGVILTRAGLFFLFEKLLPRYGGYSNVRIGSDGSDNGCFPVMGVIPCSI